MVSQRPNALLATVLFGAVLMFGGVTRAAANKADAGEADSTGATYTILHSIALDGSANIVGLAADPAGTRVYAAVGRDVRSFDAASGRPDAARTLAGDVTGLAVDSDHPDTLYATIGSPARLVTLRGHLLQPSKGMPLPYETPYSLLYDRKQQALYAESRGAHVIVRIDPIRRRIVGTVKLPGKPAQMAADGRGRLYVANSSDGAIDIVDTASMQLVGAIPLSDCQAPSGLALDPVGRRLFVPCENGAALVVDTDLGFTFERLPIARGSWAHAAFAFHPFGSSGWKGGAFFTGDSGALGAIRMNAFVRYTEGESMMLAGTGTALALDPAAHQLWLALLPHGSRGAEILVLEAKQ